MQHLKGQFILQSNNSADLDMLDEEDRKGFEDIFKPEIFDSFDQAFEWFLDKYPVFHLNPEKIDPGYKRHIKITIPNMSKRPNTFQVDQK